MKLLKMGNAMLVKELTTHLNILKAENIIVKDFEFINNDSSIRIDFMPLEEKEIVAYNFHSAQLLLRLLLILISLKSNKQGFPPCLF